MNVAVRYKTGRQELAMQVIGLLIFWAITVASFAGLSMMLYVVLPRSVLDCGARHGRYAVLGAPGRADRPQAGKTLASDYEPLQGQSA